MNIDKKNSHLQENVTKAVWNSVMDTYRVVVTPAKPAAAAAVSQQILDPGNWTNHRVSRPFSTLENPTIPNTVYDIILSETRF